MSEKLRLGIVGCGVIGHYHAAAVARNRHAELAAVADVDASKARHLAAQYDVPSVYRSGSTLCGDRAIDAVVLALPTGLRSREAKRALRGGKHVLLEKPPAMNVGQLRSYLKLRGDAVVGCCSSRFTFTDGAEEARARIACGDLGRLRILRCRGIFGVNAVKPGAKPPAWRARHSLNGGGFLVNWGIYDLDYMMHITGWSLEPETVFAQTWPIARELAKGRVHPDSDAENHVFLLVRCKCGAVITLERGEAVSQESDTAWQVTGDRGSLRLQMTTRPGPPTVVLDTADGEAGLRTEVILQDPGEVDVNAMPVHDFVSAILHERQPRTDLAKALILQKILDATYKSARTGKAVRVPARDGA